MLIALLAVGCGQDYLDEKNGNIYNSWMSHMFVNFGINTLVNYLATTLSVDKNYANDLLESYFVCNIDYASDIVFDSENNLTEKRISGILLNRLYNPFSEYLNFYILFFNKTCIFLAYIA